MKTMVENMRKKSQMSLSPSASGGTDGCQKEGDVCLVGGGDEQGEGDSVAGQHERGQLVQKGRFIVGD